MKRRAKIVVTIGPASQDEKILTRLIQAGMNVARINFSHGNHQEHQTMIKQIRHTAKRLDRPVAILQDLQGPKIRIGNLATATMELVAGQELILSTQPVSGEQNRVPVDFPELPQVVRDGGRILLDDGELELVITSVHRHEVTTKVVLGGILKSRKGINLPGTKLEIPALTAKDRDDLVFGLEQGVDAVAVSFVQSAQDIEQVRAVIKQSTMNHDVPVIAKLERPQALDHLDDIIDAADGVMVARGDLGVEIAPELVPIVQKRIIATANQYGKLVITATQMLDSMIHNPRPTRAETSDVANAIFDGSDAVMLAGESAIGKYPVESVTMMDAIICQAEAHQAEWGRMETISRKNVEQDDAISITFAGRELAKDRDVAAIVVFTQTGRTARFMAKARPHVPIFAFTPELMTCQRLNMLWGVTPYLVPFANSVETMIRHLENILMMATSIQPGQQVVILFGFPVGVARLPNVALLHTIGELVK